MSQHFDDFRREAETRVAALTEEADAGALDAAIDLLYLLVAQQNFGRSTTTLAASASAVAPHRRSSRSRRAQPKEQQA